jgi:hypothetical protein
MPLHLLAAVISVIDITVIDINVKTNVDGERKQESKGDFSGRGGCSSRQTTASSGPTKERSWRAIADRCPSRTAQ